MTQRRSAMGHNTSRWVRAVSCRMAFGRSTSSFLDTRQLLSTRRRSELALANSGGKFWICEQCERVLQLFAAGLCAGMVARSQEVQTGSGLTQRMHVSHTGMTWQQLYIEKVCIR